MSKRVDFDEIREEPIEGKFNGKWYKLPADIPIDVLASLEAAQDEEGKPGKEFELVRDQVTRLFQVHQPELTSPPCGMKELFQIIPRLYWATADEGKAKPTRPKSRGGSKKRTSSKRTSKPVRSRSSTSRAR